jgi:hypothetical protein
VVSLSRRFTLAFILIVALPSLVVSIILSTLYLSALYSTVERQSEATAREIARNIRNETDSVSLLAAALVHDSSLRSFVDQYALASGSAARLVAAEAIDAKLVSFFDYTSRIGAVVLFFKRGGNYNYSNYPNLRNLDGLDLGVCGGALEDRGKVYLLDTLSGVGGSVGEKSLLSVAVCPSRREGTELAAILVMFRSPYLDDLAAGGGGAAFDAAVFGRSGKVLLSSLPPELTKGGPPSASRELKSNGRSWLATLWPMDSTGWTILLAADRTALSARITRYQWYVYPAMVLLALLFFAYAEIFFARIAVPIRDLTRSMAKVGEGAGRRGRIAISSRMVACPEPCPPRPGPDRSDEGREPLPGSALVIEVRDDGSGMGEERLKEVLEYCREEARAEAEGRRGAGGRDDVAHRVGLANVAKRIRLEFGEPYGFAVDSETGKGTCVRLLLPALRRAVPQDTAGRLPGERADA